MIKIILGTLIAVNLLGCATRGYVLSARKQPWIFGTDENAPIAASQGLALLNDRERIISFASSQASDKARVYYRIVFKNDTEEPLTILSDKIRIEGLGGSPLYAAFDPTDKIKKAEIVGSHTYLSVSVRFEAEKKDLEALAHVDKTLELIANTKDGRDLRLKLWVWAI